jgi:hypothetical protein
MKRHKLLVTQKRLREVLRYYSQTGVFVWKVRQAHCIYVGDIAGHLHKSGYIKIRIDSVKYLAHRLAWFFVYGYWPVEVDHKDTVKHHNWIDNLRDVTRTGNNQNQTKAQSNNKTGLLGVSFDKLTGKYKAQIQVSGKKKHLGSFDTPEEAHEVYLVAKRIYHSTCTI